MTAIADQQRALPLRHDLDAVFATFLRLHVANRDASPDTIRAIGPSPAPAAKSDWLTSRWR
jgi:hypothetical protein